MSFDSPEFWVALLHLIGLNCVLSADNAVTIALVARRLPVGRQIRAFAWGGAAALAMRIGLTLVAAELLRLPYLKLVGALLLLWIAVQLLRSEPASEPVSGDAESGPIPGFRLASAIRTIALADLAMSLDNVIAVAAAAKGSTALLVIGLAISVPLVVFASTLVLKAVSRYPVIVTIGAALIGWVAGELGIADPALRGWIGSDSAFLHPAAPAFAALGVVWFGKSLAARDSTRRRADRP